MGTSTTFGNKNVLHVHSGETKHFRTTKSEQIKLFVEMCQTVREPFVNMLSSSPHITPTRVQESGIPVDTIYFDEAHNSVSVTSSVPQSISRNTQIVVTISLRLARLRSLLLNQV